MEILPSLFEKALNIDPPWKVTKIVLQQQEILSGTRYIWQKNRSNLTMQGDTKTFKNFSVIVYLMMGN